MNKISENSFSKTSLYLTVLAFQSDTRFGQQLFKNLQVSDKDLKEAVKHVRGNQRVTDQSMILPSIVCLIFFVH